MVKPSKSQTYPPRYVQFVTDLLLGVKNGKEIGTASSIAVNVAKVQKKPLNKHDRSAKPNNAYNKSLCTKL